MAVGMLLVVTACGNDADVSAVGEQTTVPVTATPATSAAPSTTSNSSSTTLEELSQCEGPVEIVDLGATVQGEVVAGELPLDSVYYCVEIPIGLDGFTVSLSGLTADLDLWVGHPDLAVVQEGRLGTVFSDNNGTDNEAVTITIDPDRLFKPGAYYIEVLAAGRDPSPFSLTVTTP